MGLFGSIARGDSGPKSDIDIFVVVDDSKDREEIDAIWYKRLKPIRKKYRRDTTVLVYTIESLKEICCWYVLRLASDGILLYDRDGKVRQLFKRIVEAANRAGLAQRSTGGSWVWYKKSMRAGEVFEVKVGH